MALLCISLALVFAAPNSHSPTAPADKPRLVTLPLKLSALPESSQSIFNELVASAIRDLGTYDVLARADIEAMLGDAGDGRQCDDVGCAVEIGGALGARLLVSGRVAKLGTSIIIVLKLIDTQEHKVLNSIKHKAPNDESAYDKALEEAVQLLFGLRTSPTVLSANARDEPLRARISKKDWLRYQRHRAIHGESATLEGWIAEENVESGWLLVAEIAFASAFVLSTSVFVEKGSKTTGQDALFPAFLALTTGGLFVLDAYNVGGVPVQDE